MNILPPSVGDAAFYEIYGGGTILFGRSSFGNGQRVGTPPIVAKIELPDSMGDAYPKDWFVVKSFQSMHKINQEMYAHANDKGMVFIPDWLRADCFEYHYNLLLHIHFDS